MKKIIFILLLSLSASILCYSQKETYNWYFGHEAGISFNPDGVNPYALTDCKLHFNQGVAVISGSKGNLLFYTNGEVIYNNNHSMMANGYDFNSNFYLGIQESQVIVPRPGRFLQYYYFYSNDYGDTTRGLWYSIVNMSKNNGLGAVTKKNVNVSNEVPYNFIALKHKNNNDFWLVNFRNFTSHNFCSYLIKEKGISDSVITDLGYNNINFYRIKASYNGTKLAALGKEKVGSNKYELYLFDFNNATGKISNPVIINDPNNMPGYFEYSADASKIYVVNWNNFSIEKGIFQYGLKSWNANDIIATRALIGIYTANPYNYTPMQIGPDRKIYIAHTQDKYLGVINNPDSNGTNCNLQKEAVYLGGKFCYASLPAFVYNYKSFYLDATTPICSGDTLFLYADSIPGAQYRWTGPNGFSSTKMNPIIPNAANSMTGYYKLHISKIPEPVNDSIYIEVGMPPFTIIPSGDTVFCEGNYINLGVKPIENKYDYRWSTGETSGIIMVKNSGTYTVTVTNSIGCRDSVSKIVKVIPNPNIKIVADKLIACEGDSIILTGFPNGDEYSYLWSNNEKTRIITVKQSGKYSLTVKNKNNCGSFASVNVAFVLKPKFSIKTNAGMAICGNDSLILIPVIDNNHYTFDWSTGETTQTIKVNMPGKYILTLTDLNGCSDSSSIIINRYEKPTPHLELIGSDKFCTGDSAIIRVKEKYVSYLWNNNETIDSIIVKISGEYFVTVVDTNGCSGVSDTINIEANNLLEVNILGNTYLCDGDSVVLSTEKEYVSYLWSTYATTRSIIVKDSDNYSITVTDSNGCAGSKSIDVQVYPNPIVNILSIGKLKFYKGDSVVLYTDGEFASYHWSTGGTTKSIIVKEHGSYTVTVTDSNGCKGSALVKVEIIEIDISITNIDNIEMDTICVGDTKIKDIKLTNYSEDDVRINSLTIKNSSGVFKVESAPKIPAALKENESITVTFTFEPDDIGTFSDSVIIEITKPSLLRYAASIKGIGAANTFVWFEEITGIVGTNICIPLKGNFAAKTEKTIDLSYNAKVSFDAYAFHPETPEAGIIKNGRRILNLSGENLRLSNEPVTLATICGMIFLSNNESSAIRIDEFHWNEETICVDTTHGKLVAKGVCRQSLRAVKSLTPTQMQIIPIPAPDEVDIQIKTQERGKFELNIYSIEGMKIETRDWYKTNNIVEQWSIKFKLNDYSNGLYQVVLKTQAEAVVKQMIVIK